MTNLDTTLRRIEERAKGKQGLWMAHPDPEKAKLCKALRRALDFLDVLGSDLIKADIAAIIAEQDQK